jgi:glycosyltransferase involved in cell wall biosynthesis
MHVLFVHRAFPAQFGRLGLELTERYGWKCSFLVQHLSKCPSPSPGMLQKLTMRTIPASGASSGTPWPQQYGSTIDLGAAVFEVVRQTPELWPDLVVGHGGLVPTLFLRGLLHWPTIDYCEYYFAPAGRDLTYRTDLAVVEPAAFFPRCINAATLVNLTAADAGYAPTEWQRRSFPERFWPKIEVHFDGVDTQLFRPQQLPRMIAGSSVPPDTRIITYVARGLESMRGFDLFLRLAGRILRERPDVLFVVAGDEEVYYGWDKLRTGSATFKEWALKQGNYDLSRFIFLGHIEPERLAEVLALSDLHVYLSVPFVLSWSFFDALAAGCVVLAGDSPPVGEIIEPGKTGLVEPLMDSERLAETALKVLANPAQYKPLGRAAREMMEQHYSLDTTIPAIKDFFERVVQKRR